MRPVLVRVSNIGPKRTLLSVHARKGSNWNLEMDIAYVRSWGSSILIGATSTRHIYLFAASASDGVTLIQTIDGRRASR